MSLRGGAKRKRWGCLQTQLWTWLANLRSWEVAIRRRDRIRMAGELQAFGNRLLRMLRAILADLRGGPRCGRPSWVYR